MKYATIDASGLPTGFYSPDMHDDIPQGAVELTEAQWQDCIDNAGRRQIAVAADGSVTVQPYSPPLAPASERRKAAKANIDRAAGSARMRFVSPGDLVEQEYREAESAAKQWQDAGEPAAGVPAEVQVWADAAGMTPSAAAKDIIQTGQAWRDVLAQVRTVRLQGKAAIDAAAEADIETTAQGYIDQLDAVAPA